MVDHQFLTLASLLVGVVILVFLWIVAGEDVVSTNRFLKLGLGEATPLMAWAQRRFGKLWFMVKMGLYLIVTVALGFAFAGSFLWDGHPYSKWFIVILWAMYFGVAWGITQMRKAVVNNNRFSDDAEARQHASL